MPHEQFNRQKSRLKCNSLRNNELRGREEFLEKNFCNKLAVAANPRKPRNAGRVTAPVFDYPLGGASGKPTV